MKTPDMDVNFNSSISRVYESYLVPLIFEPYAQDMARRVSLLPASRVLEIACGTGVVTRALSKELSTSVAITATDLNQSMLDVAASSGETPRVEFMQADALALPFDDGTFDVVVCQFGVMFFSDKPKAFSEARRVLKHHGKFLFSVWDRIERNEFAHTITKKLDRIIPTGRSHFMARIPHGYFDHATIANDLSLGGFNSPPIIETLSERSRAASARVPAIAYCQGTPMRNEIELLGPTKLSEATDIAELAIVDRFGSGEVVGGIQAHIVQASR